MKVSQLIEGLRYGEKEKGVVEDNLESFSISFSFYIHEEELNEDISGIHFGDYGLASTVKQGVHEVRTKHPISGSQIPNALVAITKVVDELSMSGFHAENNDRLTMTIIHQSGTLNVGKFIALSELFQFGSNKKGDAYQFITKNIDSVIRQLVMKNLNVTDKNIGEILLAHVEESLDEVKRAPLNGKYSGMGVTAIINDNAEIDVTVKLSDIASADNYVDLIYRIMYTILASHDEQFNNEYRKASINKINKAFLHTTGVDVNDAIYNVRTSLEVMKTLNLRSPYDVSDLIEKVIGRYEGSDVDLLKKVNQMIEDNKNMATIQTDYRQVLMMFKRDWHRLG